MQPLVKRKIYTMRPRIKTMTWRLQTKTRKKLTFI